jgi:hypothetical protein
MDVLHKCDNPPCVNPEHLFLGTDLENMRDCVAKGRHANMQGCRNPRAILTETDVVEIRKKYSGKSYSGLRLAREYGVHKNTIYFVLSGKHWRATTCH